MIDQDRIERERKTIGYLIAVVFGGGALSMLVCGGLFLTLVTESGESSASDAEHWFKTVVQADASSFDDIQHYTDQGIDFSHHFRFRFASVDDVVAIAKYHGLTPDQRAEPMDLALLPDWYDPQSVATDARRYPCGGSEPIVLIVDFHAKIAYFELVHL